MSIKAETTFSLKDQLFNRESVGNLSERLVHAYPMFEHQSFEEEVLARFPELELKERIGWIVTALESYLLADFLEAQEILRRALPEPLDPSRTDDDFGEFIWVVPGEFVSKHGCAEAYLDVSLDFLRESTKRFSAEGAIRPFLRQFPAQTLSFVRQCTTDHNYHVRRLASEGIRPFLPWAERVEVPIDEVIAVLGRLHADKTRYVTRSVANTLNDLSKIDASRVIETLEHWQADASQEKSELDWMTRHALRTLVKDNHAPALELLGYPSRPSFDRSELTVAKQVCVGESLALRCTLTSQAKQKLKIGLRIHFLKANGSHSTKVFAVKDRSFDKGQCVEISGQQLFKPLTTRIHYPGTHYVDLVVNGIASEKHAFELAN